jgi:hypothetical protein
VRRLIPLSLAVVLTLGAFAWSMGDSGQATSGSGLAFLFPGGNTEGLVGSVFGQVVLIQSVSNVSAYEFDVTYDDAVVSVVGFQPGDFLDSPTCSTSTPVAGTFHVSCDQPGGPGETGTGFAGQVTFEFNQNMPAGTLDLGLENCAAFEPDGDPVTLTVCKSTTLNVIKGHSGMELWPPEGFKTQGLGGATVQTAVNIEGVTDVAAWTFDLTYEEEKVAFDSFAQGTYGTFLNPADCLTTPLGPGAVRVSCIRIGGPGETGGGGLGELTFEFLQNMSGTLGFALSNCEAADADGDPVPITVCDAQQTIDVSAVPPPVQMTLSPQATSVQATAGQAVVVDALIANGTDMGGLEFAVEFDDTKLSLTNITEGPWLSSLGADTICIFVPVPVYTSNFGCVTMGKFGAVSGGGTIAHITFTVVAPFTGTTDISLSACEAADVQGFYIPVSECGGATIQSTLQPPQPPPPAVGGISRTPLGR